MSIFNFMLYLFYKDSKQENQSIYFMILFNVFVTYMYCFVFRTC